MIELMPRRPGAVRLTGKVCPRELLYARPGAQWQEEDFYVSLSDELALIRAAGFPRPDCFWRDGLIAVYGAFKDDHTA
jgi:hypothetical protein